MLALALALAVQEDSTPHSSVRLSALRQYVPGVALTATVHIELEPSWHTYWKNPGETGEPTRVRWSLPEGWKLLDEAWTAPSRFTEGGMTYFGYAGRAAIRATVLPPKDAADEATLNAHVQYLVCSDACLPASADVAVTLGRASRPPSLDAGPDGVVGPPFPEKLGNAGEWWLEEGRVKIRFPAQEGFEPGDFELFAESPGLVDPASQPLLASRSRPGSHFEFTLARAGFADDKLSDVTFVAKHSKLLDVSYQFVAIQRPPRRN